MSRKRNTRRRFREMASRPSQVRLRILFSGAISSFYRQVNRGQTFHNTGSTRVAGFAAWRDPPSRLPFPIGRCLPESSANPVD